MFRITYAGLSLRNPIIAASSSRTNSAQNNLALEDAGVGAIVLKSLFEENIRRAEAEMMKDAQHVEAADYLQAYLRNHELNEYVALIKESKRVCSVPIIASINAINTGEWVDFARLIEDAGADALEINIMSIESALNADYGSVEQRHIDILCAVRAVVNIPVIVKLGSMLSNVVTLVDKLKAHGAAAVVLFNRQYQNDINIDTEEFAVGDILSSNGDFALPLRWVGLVSSKVKGIDVVHSGGVCSAEDIVKAILVGATAVQVCSVLYREGNGWVTNALIDMQKWHDSKGYEKLDSYRGKLNADSEDNQETLMRTQFLRHFGSM